jgi:hypothetical protein
MPGGSRTRYLISGGTAQPGHRLRRLGRRRAAFALSACAAASCLAGLGAAQRQPPLAVALAVTLTAALALPAVAIPLLLRIDAYGRAGEHGCAATALRPRAAITYWACRSAAARPARAARGTGGATARAASVTVRPRGGCPFALPAGGSGGRHGVPAGQDPHQVP